MRKRIEHDMQVAALIARELSGEALSADESEMLRSWMDRAPGNKEFHEACLAGNVPDDFKRVVALANERARWRRLYRGVRGFAPARRRQLFYAASAAVLLAIGWWFAGGGNGRDERDRGDGRLSIAAGEVIAPASSKAVLVTADGQQYAFEERDTTFDAGGSRIVFAGGQMQDATGEGEGGEGFAAREAYAGGYNVLIVPVSGIFSVILQDGTRVFLNSASRLEYPVMFGASSREVFLEGEAFFDVASDPGRPFVVRTGNAEARVLGTSFNLLAYADEPVHELTLLSGGVEIASGGAVTRLRPGTRASWEAPSLQVNVKEIDPATCSLWKENIIMLDERPLKVVARMLERWYDVNILFDEGVEADRHTFTGKIDMNLDLGSVLQTLTLLGGPRFEMEGRSVHVYRNTLN
ncbi:MAG: FecR domain-containing protein [Odoribacteraceae bacterium]|jgi:ferric-dicitrate binding protein FerR (iron transport regulator)|nr:FecR domain-containing protein [Odoribacteraceae bacterium]